MAGIVVCGGGACGLIAALLLAGDGHDVTVLEQDVAAPPDPADAWEAWERRGVNQFRLPHAILPRWRHEVEHELPDVLEALTKAGAHAGHMFEPFKAVLPHPERFEIVTARRPVFEAVLADQAERTIGISIRRGVSIRGLETGPSVRQGVPHVVAVRTGDGERIAADLVVAVTGRRSALGRWLAEAGARPPHDEIEDSGFCYYGRHVRSRHGGPMVPMAGMRDYGSVAIIALPGDNGTAGIGIIGAADDRALRPLRQEEVWQRTMRALPGGAELLDSEPISPLVSIAGLEDRYRRFVLDGAPVVTGVVAVADAWAATNPSLGRGITMGTMHAKLLRRAIREHMDDPHQLALAFDEATEATLTPWYRATVWNDRNKLADVSAEAEETTREDRDPDWDALSRLVSLVGRDPEVSARLLEGRFFMAETPAEILADPAIRAKVPDPSDIPPRPGPSRRELLEILAA